LEMASTRASINRCVPSGMSACTAFTNTFMENSRSSVLLLRAVCLFANDAVRAAELPHSPPSWYPHPNSSSPCFQHVLRSQSSSPQSDVATTHTESHIAHWQAHSQHLPCPHKAHLQVRDRQHRQQRDTNCGHLCFASRAVHCVVRELHADRFSFLIEPHRPDEACRGQRCLCLRVHHRNQRTCT
jgi:hypothetical protein